VPAHSLLLTVNQSLPQWPYPKTIAHRGAGKLAPENTLAAIRHGVSFGYRACEFDVKLSRDNVLLLMHDSDLDRTSNGKGAVAAHDWAQLSQLDAGAWHSPSYAGEPIPTFANVIAQCNANDVAMNVEIKASPGRERETGAAIARSCSDLCGSVKTQPLLSSFSTEALVAARDAVPSVLLAHLFQDPLPSDWSARCKRVGAIALDANWKSLSEAIVREAHANGLRVVCYTCNEISDAEKLWSWGVDSVITDSVDSIAFRQ
jgi:glycerophosphoryl diester phosphodiesterase